MHGRLRERTRERDARQRAFAWWQRGVIYQVYPRSFQDANGDGVGDLEGVRRRLPYLQDLGVDAIWLSPIYPSPMKDFGYDVSDYCGIDPAFGTMDDFERLLEDVHARGMRVILDFVPNHTSDEHPWFVESRSSRESPKRDWYIWRDPKPDGSPPSNWRSVAGGSAWELDERTGQYYYHAYLVEQPDLNWRNPAVRRAMTDAMRFWLEKGVDGFRMDVIWHLIKDEELRDNPPNRDHRPGNAPYHELLPLYTTDRPEVHDVIRDLRAVLDEYPDRMMVGEIYLPIERLVLYYGSDEGGGVHLPFNFHLISTPWHARAIESVVERYETALPRAGWPNWVLGNHDRSRVASRIGRAQARVAAVLLLTMRGTPTLYYGDELGMRDVPIPPERVVDPWEKNVPGIGFGRDPVRTPMQWTAGEPNAGFSTANPWLPLAPDAGARNVETLLRDDRSILNLHRRLLALRRAEPALSVGDVTVVPAAGNVLAYVRSAGPEDTRFLVALNLDHAPQPFSAPPSLRGKVALSASLTREGEEFPSESVIAGDEGLVVALDAADPA